MKELTLIEGATSRHDDNGNEIIEVATCGTCGRSWNNAAVSHLTPAPSGRCPFEYEHDEDEDEARYEIVRFKFKGESEIIEADVSLEEAQEHCDREDTHGDGWFDGYREI